MTYLVWTFERTRYHAGQVLGCHGSDSVHGIEGGKRGHGDFSNGVRAM